MYKIRSLHLNVIYGESCLDLYNFQCSNVFNGQVNL
jgi:hypothetical protein